MRIFISAGEPSGDLHAANLVKSLRAIRPDVEVVGFGGPHLEATGAKVLYPLVELAVMWFGRVLLNLHKFFALADQAEAYFRDEKPPPASATQLDNLKTPGGDTVLIAVHKHSVDRAPTASQGGPRRRRTANRSRRASSRVAHRRWWTSSTLRVWNKLSMAAFP